MPDYTDLGRMTAAAILAGRLDADGLAEVCRAVLDLDRSRALSIVRLNLSVPNPTGETYAHP
ncbi:UNVERIFIED_ORG: hypothetical protein L601_001500000160 [Gordonia westfalica J30]